MFNYLTGKVISVNQNHLVLDVNNIGYDIEIPLSKNIIIDSIITIYTYFQIKETSLSIYGFNNIDDKDTFINLISVKGLGPKGALKILSSYTSNEIIDAINNQDIKFFSQIHSIGIKTAQQIIMDLEKKYKKKNANNNSLLKELKDSLKNLGCSEDEITSIIDNLDINCYLDIDDLLIDALKLIKKMDF